MEKLFRLLFCSTFLLIPLLAVEGQLLFSPYYDSNVQEKISEQKQTYGLKLRGSLWFKSKKSRYNFYGNILGQSFFDALLFDESKMVINSEMGLVYFLSPTLQIRNQFVSFNKSFFGQSRSYKWMNYNLQMEKNIHSQFSFILGYSTKSTLISIPTAIKYNESSISIGERYKISSKIILEGFLSKSLIHFNNYKARVLKEEVIVIDPLLNQSDRSLQGTLHLRYHSDIIAGGYIGYEIVKSNSVIAVYDQASVRIYLSGRLGKQSYYHFVFQGIDKNYRYPSLIGISYFRDPEESIQNRTYVQLERILKNDIVVFFQISYLQNETLSNRQYYNKSIFEFGIKYTF